jgi:branched-chain amino acid transport system ATP-binding protein
MTAVLQIEDLTAGYGDLAAVRGVDVTVAAGEVVALLGPNGAGKTTLLRVCAGLIPEMAGCVRWAGAVASGPLHRRARSGLGYVPEERGVIAGLDVRANLALGAGGIEPVLGMFPELEPLLGRRAGLLSGGEQQMLVLGRALAARPRVLLVDELSLGLAPLVVQRLLDELRRAADVDGLAVLLVEQQARRALGIADRWYLLRNGRVTASGGGGTDAAELAAAYLTGPG